MNTSYDWFLDHGVLLESAQAQVADVRGGLQDVPPEGRRPFNVDEVLEKYGRLDIFFANAGIIAGAERILDASADNFMKTMRTNALR